MARTKNSSKIYNSFTPNYILTNYTTTLLLFKTLTEGKGVKFRQSTESYSTEITWTPLRKVMSISIDDVRGIF